MVVDEIKRHAVQVELVGNDGKCVLEPDYTVVVHEEVGRRQRRWRGWLRW